MACTYLYDLIILNQHHITNTCNNNTMCMHLALFGPVDANGDIDGTGGLGTRARKTGQEAVITHSCILIY